MFIELNELYELLKVHRLPCPWVKYEYEYGVNEYEYWFHEYEYKNYEYSYELYELIHW